MDFSFNFLHVYLTRKQD